MLHTLTGVGHDAKNIASVGEALDKFDMNWGVEVRPTYFQKNDGTLAPMGTSFATLRSDNEQFLGRVGGDYVPMRNVDALSHVDALLASGIGTLDSVFELKHGKHVGATIKLNEQISIANEDPIELYISVTTSHDGTRADKTMITPIRLWCTNQLALASREAKQSWSVRHLSTMSDNLKLVEQELKDITNYAEWLQATGDRLVNDSIKEIELAQLVIDAMDFLRDEDRKKKMTGEIIDVFKFSNLIGDDFKNTAWGGLNAVTEYFDHHRTYRSPQSRYNSITNGVGARVRNNMAELLLAR